MKEKPKEIDFITPMIACFLLSGFALAFLFPYVFAIRVPFLQTVDSTHLYAFGIITELPYNIPGLVVFLFSFFLLLVLVSILTMGSIWGWLRFREWGMSQTDEKADSNPAEVAEGAPALLLAQDSQPESETLKMPESKVLQDDPNSL